jgi:trans-2,3-dihydro-3-hydroxyanthranilate isomerase
LTPLGFFLVDVFAETKYAGNQLAVFRNGHGLSDREMQQLARETNFSETTFILSDEPRDGGFDVRIFTPNEEVPFAGHPTLGTAFVIQQQLIRRPVENVTLNLKVGRIPVRFSYVDAKPDVLWMTQKPPKFGPVFDRSRIARVLGM